MTAASKVRHTVPSPAAPPPCAEDPERWVDRADRTQALLTCLRCPVRRWCAQEALRVEASWGMWAGIWIDGRHSQIAGRLRAIVAEPTPTATIVVAPEVEPTADIRPPLPRRRPRRSGRSAPVSTLVQARSFGHCEILGSECRLNADMECSRIVGQAAQQASSASEVFAACGPCAAAINAAPVADVQALGHVVDSAGRASYVPFRWRGARWVILGVRGELREVDPGIGTARAC